MMKNIFLMMMVFAALGSQAQTKGKARLYAYVQTVAPGVDRGTIDISGEEVPSTNKVGRNYYIYIAADTRIYPSEIWIDGVQYGVAAKAITETPVKKETPSGTKVLVPKTTRKLWMLETLPVTGGKTARGRTMAKKNGLVVVYKQSGKFYFNSLSNLTELETAALQ